MKNSKQVAPMYMVNTRTRILQFTCLECEGVLDFSSNHMSSCIEVSGDRKLLHNRVLLVHQTSDLGIECSLEVTFEK